MKTPTAAMRVLCLAVAFLPGLVANAVTNNPSATFMQGRVNLPYTMYNKGYYVIGSFQVCAPVQKL